MLEEDNYLNRQRIGPEAEYHDTILKTSLLKILKNRRAT